MPKPDYIIRNHQSLNLHFYQEYDENFLYHKAQTLQLAAEKQEEFKLFIISNGGDAEEIDQKFFDALRTEVYFTEFHQFEAFFAILIAIFQDLPHWLYLTTYTTKEIKTKAEAFLKGDFKTASNGKAENRDDFLSHAIYSWFMPLLDDQQKGWSKNLENISWSITRMANKYMQGVEYNAYKHGLRVIAGPTALSIKPENNINDEIKIESGDSVTFLELKDRGEGGLTVHETTKHFDPMDSINHLNIMSSLLKTIKSTRLARIKGDDDVVLTIFSELDKEEIIKHTVVTSWSLTI